MITIALAGIAEAALSVQLIYSWIALIVISIFAISAFMSEKIWLLVIAVVLAYVFAVFLAPWEVPFVALTPEEQNDPDIVMWYGRFQMMAITWYIVAMGTAGVYVWFCFRQLNKAKIKQQSSR